MGRVSFFRELIRLSQHRVCLRSDRHRTCGSVAPDTRRIGFCTENFAQNFRQKTKIRQVGRGRSWTEG